MAQVALNDRYSCTFIIPLLNWKLTESSSCLKNICPHSTLCKVFEYCPQKTPKYELIKGSEKVCVCLPYHGHCSRCWRNRVCLNYQRQPGVRSSDLRICKSWDRAPLRVQGGMPSSCCSEKEEDVYNRVGVAVERKPTSIVWRKGNPSNSQSLSHAADVKIRRLIIRRLLLDWRVFYRDMYLGPAEKSHSGVFKSTGTKLPALKPGSATRHSNTAVWS